MRPNQLPGRPEGSRDVKIRSRDVEMRPNQLPGRPEGSRDVEIRSRDRSRDVEIRSRDVEIRSRDAGCCHRGVTFPPGQNLWTQRLSLLSPKCPKRAILLRKCPEGCCHLGVTLGPGCCHRGVTFPPGQNLWAQGDTGVTPMGSEGDTRVTAPFRAFTKQNNSFGGSR
jgi:hypothetical protein